MQVTSPDTSPKLPDANIQALDQARQQVEVMRLEAERWRTIARAEERNAKAAVAERLGEEEKLASLIKEKDNLLAEIADAKDINNKLAIEAHEISEKSLELDKQSTKNAMEAAQMLVDVKAEKENVEKEKQSLAEEKAAFEAEKKVFIEKVEKLKSLVA